MLTVLFFIWNWIVFFCFHFIFKVLVMFLCIFVLYFVLNMFIQLFNNFIYWVGVRTPVEFCGHRTECTMAFSIYDCSSGIVCFPLVTNTAVAMSSADVLTSQPHYDPSWSLIGRESSLSLLMLTLLCCFHFCASNTFCLLCAVDGFKKERCCTFVLRPAEAIRSVFLSQWQCTVPWSLG